MNRRRLIQAETGAPQSQEQMTMEQVMSSDAYFSESYEDARAQFLRAGTRLEARLASFPVDGWNGAQRAPSTDVACLGNPDAKRVLLIVSGTHGPEGLAGSACQQALIDDLSTDGPTEEVEVVLVHAVNAWAVASGLRCTEEGVDLNRNYTDFSRCSSEQHASNRKYDQVHEYMHSLSRTLSARDFLDQGPDLLGENCGTDAVNTLFQGQYRHADGVGFGGLAPTMGRRRFERILSKVLKNKQEVAVVDLHTGLGPYGVGMKLSVADVGGDDAVRTRRWFGDDVILINAPESDLPYRVFGDTSEGVRRMLDGARITGLTLEYGTYEVNGLVRCILAEFLIRHRSQVVDEDLAAELKREISAFFYPTDPNWREQVIDQARTVFSQAMIGLTEV